MKPAPLVPARIETDADGMPSAPAFDDRYHPRQGALLQARHVFLAGNGLPDRWRGRPRFVVLETGFGLGNNFLATWQSWRDDPARCERLEFVSIEAHPLRRPDLAALPREPALAALSLELIDAWPPLVPGLHELRFDGGKVRLTLAFGDVRELLPQLVASVDAFYLDGFAPARNPAMWEGRLFKAMARMAARDATVATWTAANAVRDGLRSAGFDVELAPGKGGKRDITVGRFAPRFTPRTAPRRGSVVASHPGRRDEPVLIVGAGLAGCALAAALAREGLSSIVVERRRESALEGSGNAAGLFHGVVHRDDGRHARVLRAAALAAADEVARAIASGRVRGGADGLLRLEPGGDIGAMRTLAERLGLPADHARPLAAIEATAIAGVALREPAWLFGRGGWVEPRQLAAWWLEGATTSLRADVAIDRLQRDEDRWLAFDAEGRTVARSHTVVLANAGDAFRLLGTPTPLRARRGQVSGLTLAASSPLQKLRVPLAGSGYLLPELDGVAWFGSTVHDDDDDGSIRLDDHRRNLERLAGLLAEPPTIDEPRQLAGRVAWRWASTDRLPLIGAVPLAMAGESLGLARADAASPRPEQPRFAPRAPGLYLFTGLGSRGIAVASLGGRVLAAMLAGSPMPLEADLLDAIDPARFASRAWRRLGDGPGTAG